MDLLIKGKTIPKYCSQCICFHSELNVCKIDYGRTITTSNVFIKRPDSCPLKEIPAPHGRLIDADRLMEVIEQNAYTLINYCNSKDRGMFLCGIRQAIDEAPTIIEAEE